MDRDRASRIELESAGRLEQCLRSISGVACELERISFDAIFTTDRKGIITSSSHGAESLLGLFPNEANGLLIDTYFCGGAKVTAEIMGLLNEEGRIRNFLTDLLATNGRRISVSISASAFKDGTGDIAAALIVAHNLTEMRKLEDELAAKNRFMANILQDSADAIITLDPEDIITSWNKGAEGIFGYSEKEALGRSINIIIPQDLQEANELAWIGEKIRSQGVVNSFQTDRNTKDGRRIQVIFTRTAIRDDSGRMIGSSAVLKDVTTYRNLERQLADAEHLATLGELSAGLAHEIKNPLAGIKGAIEVIRDSIPVSDAHREILGDVIHEVNRIDTIVRDLLNYAKPKPPSHLDINLQEMIQRTVAMVRKSVKHESLSIELHQLSDIPGFTADETQLEQVILNLLLNAQYSMPPGGKIDIRFSYDPKLAAVRIEVEDNGPGIPEEARKKLFQPFFTTRRDGTGLGLATCMKNVQYHGGSIEVHSQMGQGTRFLITLPMISRL